MYIQSLKIFDRCTGLLQLAVRPAWLCNGMCSMSGLQSLTFGHNFDQPLEAVSLGRETNFENMWTPQHKVGLFTTVPSRTLCIPMGWFQLWTALNNMNNTFEPHPNLTGGINGSPDILTKTPAIRHDFDFRCQDLVGDLGFLGFEDLGFQGFRVHCFGKLKSASATQKKRACQRICGIRRGKRQGCSEQVSKQATPSISSASSQTWWVWRNRCLWFCSSRFDTDICWYLYIDTTHSEQHR